MQNNSNKQKVGLQVSRILKRSEKKSPLKYYDVVGSYGITTAGTALDITPIPQGVGNNQRTGDEIHIEYIDYKDAIFCADATNIMRVVFAQSLGATGQGFTSLLSIGNGGTYQYNSQYTPYIEKRIRVLSDKYHTLSQSGWTDCLVNSYRVPVNKKVVYNPALTTYVSGQIVLYMLSDSGAAPTPTVNSCLRIWYRDI